MTMMTSNKWDQSARIKASAAGMLARRPLSKAVLYDKLVLKGYDEGLAGETVEWLEHMGYINDAAYAEAKAKSMTAKGYGSRRIAAELKRLGVSEDDMQSATETIDEDAAGETITALIHKRLKGAVPDRKGLKNLYDYLYRRGFGWDEIKSAVEDYLETAEDEDEED